MKYCTYVTTHPTGLFYIGKGIIAKINKGYKGSGTKFTRMLKKYPKEEWTIKILKTFEDEILAYAEEAKLVTDEVLENKLCLNIARGGWGTPKEKGNRWSAEAKKKQSIKMKAQWANPELRAKQSQILKNRIITEEHNTNRLAGIQRAKNEGLYKGLKGSPSLEAIENMKIAQQKYVKENYEKAAALGKKTGAMNKGRKATEQTKIKMRLARSGAKHSDEAKEKIRLSRLGKKKFVKNDGKVKLYIPGTEPEGAIIVKQKKTS